MIKIFSCGRCNKDIGTRRDLRKHLREDYKMKKKKKQKEEVKIVSVKSNPKIKEIVADYPKSIIAFPRARFEEQLKNHLLKHKVK